MGSDRFMTPLYLARVQPRAAINVYRVDSDREILVASVVLPLGAGLRATLYEAGWQVVPCRSRSEWGAVCVEPIGRSTIVTRVGPQ